MSSRQERIILREFDRIYNANAERVATYTRRYWGFTIAAWLLIFTATLLTTIGSGRNGLCLVLAVLGGVAIGFAIMHSAAARQMPLFLRYTTLRAEALQERLDELNPDSE